MSSLRAPVYLYLALAGVFVCLVNAERGVAQGVPPAAILYLPHLAQRAASLAAPTPTDGYANIAAHAHANVDTNALSNTDVHANFDGDADTPYHDANADAARLCNAPVYADTNYRSRSRGRRSDTEHCNDLTDRRR